MSKLKGTIRIGLGLLLMVGFLILGAGLLTLVGATVSMFDGTNNLVQTGQIMGLGLMLNFAPMTIIMLALALARKNHDPLEAAAVIAVFFSFFLGVYGFVATSESRLDAIGTGVTVVWTLILQEGGFITFILATSLWNWINQKMKTRT